MALRCFQLSFDNPFEKKALWNVAPTTESPDTRPEGEKRAEAKEKIENNNLIPDSVKKLNALLAKAPKEKLDVFLATLDAAIQQANAIERISSTLSPDAVKALWKDFSDHYSDFEMSESDVKELIWARRTVTERLQLMEDHLKDNPDALKKNALSFLKEGNSYLGSNGTVALDKTYTADFKNPGTGAINTFAQDKLTWGNVFEAAGITTAEITRADGSKVLAHLEADGKTYDAKHNYVKLLEGYKMTPKEKATEAAPLVAEKATAPAVTVSGEGISTVTGRPIPSEHEDSRPKGAPGYRDPWKDEMDRGAPPAGVDMATTTRHVEFGMEPSPEKSPQEIEAEARLTEFEAGEAARQTKHIEQGRSELKRGDIREVPAVMKGWKGQTYAERFYDLDYGSQILGSLKTLADIDPKSNTETEMWEVIRRKTFLGDPDKISYQEITQAVFDQTPNGLVQREARLKESVAKGRLAPEKMAAAKEELANIEKFYGAAWVLMNTIDKLRTRKNDTSAEAGEKVTVTPDIQTMEAVCDILFDKKNEGPVIELSLLQKIFAGGKSEHAVNMQLYAGKARMSDRMQQYISDQAAWQYLTQKVLSSNLKTGALELTEANKTTFVKMLNDLRSKGVADASADLVLSKEVYEKDKKTVKEKYTKRITWETMQNDLSDRTQRELVRRGTAVDLGEEFVRTQSDEKEALKERAPDPITAHAMEVIIEMAPELTTEELKEVSDNLHNYYIGTAGIVLNNAESKNAIGVGLDGQFPLNKKGTLSVHMGFLDDVCQQTFEFHGGIDGHTKVGRFDLGFQAGASENLQTGPGVGVGVNGGLALDSHHAWNIVASASVGAGLDKVALNPLSIASCFALTVGIDRQMKGVVEKKTAKFNKEQKEYMDTAIATYRTLFAASMPPEQYAEFEAQLMETLKQQLGDQAIDDLKHVQFLGAGLAFIPCLSCYPIPYIKMGWRGKKFLAYNRPKNDPNLDKVAEYRIEKELKELSKKQGMGATNDVVPVYTSGVLQRSVEGNGSTTITEARFRKDELAAPEMMAARLQGMEAQGLHLEGTPEGEIKLDVFKVDGSVDLYVDPKSQIQSYVGPEGSIYLNLDKDDALSIRRVDEYYPFESFGQTHRVKLYISNNAHVDNKVIEGESAQHIHYTDAMDVKTKAEVVTHQEAVSGIFTDGIYDSKQTMLDADVKEGTAIKDIQEDLASRVGVRDQMKKLLDQEHTGPALSEQDRTDIEAMAKDLLQWDMEETEVKMVKGHRMRVNKPDAELTPEQLAQRTRRREYKELSVHGEYGALTKYIKEQFPAYPWDNTKLTFMLQALTVEAAGALLSTEEGPFEEAREHNIEWNTKAATDYLVQYGHMDPVEAASVAGKIIKAYFNPEKYNKASDYSRREAIQKGSIVHILVGTEGIAGYRENFWDPKSHGPLLDPVDLNVDDLREAFPTLTPDEAKDFVKAVVSNSLSPLEYDQPEKLMRSQLGLEVLDAADIIFSPAEGAQLVKLFEEVQKGTTPIPAEYKKLFEDYAKIVKDLRENGIATTEFAILHKSEIKKVGLYEKCVNFTVTMNETISIEMKVHGVGTKAVQVEVRDYIKAREATTVIGAGVAVITCCEGPPPPPTTDTGSKAPGAVDLPGQALTPGASRPNVHSNDADIGSGGTPTE